MDFHALFDAHYVPVFRYLAHRLGDRAAAEDLAAETFLRAYASRAGFVSGSPRAWVFTIATNLLRDHTRGAGRRAVAYAEWAGRAGTVAEPEFELPDPGLARALEALRSEEREVLLLFAWAELSYEEIATVTAVAVGTVRSRLARARARLTAELAPGAEPTMTVDERLREAHGRIPDPDAATITRARERLAAGDRAPARRRRRVLAPLLPLAALAAAVAAVAALAPQRDDEVPVVPPAAPATVTYERNTFAISIRYIAADGRPTASHRDAAYGIARSVPEEIWRAPDGSGRIQYGAESAPYLPSPADERAWRAAGSPDLDKLAGEPGRWGPKKTTYGPGELDDALLWNSNLEAVLPRRDPLSVLPREPRELASWLNDAAAKQRRGAPARVVRDTVVDDALTFLRDPRSPAALRVALIDVLQTLPSAQPLSQVRDAANRQWPGIELPSGMVIAYNPRTHKVMAKGARYADGVRWNLTYAVVSASVAAIGDRP